MSPVYEITAVYDDDRTAHLLHLIAVRCPALAAEASIASRVTGASRQMRFDRLVPVALATGQWSETERLNMVTAQGVGLVAGDSGQRTVPVQIKLTALERAMLAEEARAEGKTLSELIRWKVFG